MLSPSSFRGLEKSEAKMKAAMEKAGAPYSGSKRRACSPAVDATPRPSLGGGGKDLQGKKDSPPPPTAAESAPLKLLGWLAGCFSLALSGPDPPLLLL